jgi:hypothetical protein
MNNGKDISHSSAISQTREMLPADDKTALEQFLFNNIELEQLETIVDKFNIFLSLGIVNQEVRHSNFLAWLLDPNETHGLQDYFLKLFLKYVAVHNQNALKEVTIIDIDSWDFDSTVVLKEWSAIDILVIDEKLKFLCVIENKVDSREHSDQLARYQKIVDVKYPDYKKLFIYLTVNGERPEKDEIYISLSYSQVSDIITRLLQARSSQLSGEIVTFVQHYQEMIKRFIMEESEVQALCEQIYNKHKKALDLIFAYKPDIYTNVCEAACELLTVDFKDTLIKDHHSKTAIKFIPHELDFIPKKGDGWTRSKRILMFEIQNVEKAVSLALMMGPGDQQIRETIYTYAKQDPKFNSTWANTVPSKWSTIYKVELVKIKNLEGKTKDEIKDFLKFKLESFFSGDYIHISTSIKSIAEQIIAQSN